MQDRIKETFRQAEARLAELQATPQGRKLAEWDEGFGRLIAWVEAATCVICACIAAAMAALVMAAVDGFYWIAAAAIGAAMVLLLLWRAWRAIRRPQTVSGRLIGEAGAQLGPARMVIGLASRLRRGDGSPGNRN
jgi:hypothetical protein